MFMEHTPVRKWKAGLGRERSWHTHGCPQGLSQPFRELVNWDYLQSIPIEAVVFQDSHTVAISSTLGET